MSPVIDCTSDEGRERGLDEATDAVRRGSIVVLPTDTVYGVGADAFDAVAVGSLLTAKGRGREMPPPVLVPDARTVDGLATEVPAYARKLIEAHWPGPLTLILKAQPSLMWDLGETNGTVGVRMPDHPVALALLERTGPLAVTSANRTGNPAATTVLDAATQLGAAVEVYLDGGTSPGGAASTIVDCTRDVPVVLREGPVGPNDIAAAVRAAQADAGQADDGQAGEPAPPGDEASPDVPSEASPEVPSEASPVASPDTSVDGPPRDA